MKRKRIPQGEIVEGKIERYRIVHKGNVNSKDEIKKIPYSIEIIEKEEQNKSSNEKTKEND